MWRPNLSSVMLMVVAAVALAAALVGTAGCEDEFDAADGAATRPSGRVVQLSVLMEPDASGVWRQLFADFHRQHPNIIVNHVEGPSATNSREDLYVTSFLSGQTPYDLILADVVWVPKFAAAGWLEDLTDRWPKEKWDQFIEGSLEGGSYRGRIYRVPTQMDAGLLYYRTDLLQAAGEQPPKTFADLVRISQKLQNPSALWGFVWQGKQYEGLSCDFLEVLAGHGGTWVNPDTNEVGLDQPPAIEAMRFMVNCINQYRISPPGVTTYSEEESRQLFHNGRAVFLRNWPYVWQLSQREDSPIRGKVGMVPMPAAPGGKPAGALGGWGFCIAKGSTHKEEAWEFVEYISQLPQLLRIREGTGANPPAKAFYEQSDDPALHAIYEVYKVAVPRPTLPQYAQASDILQRYVSAALTGRMSPEEAMQGAARETRLLLGQQARR